jgi:uncharacterized protein YndB with AHSA1/START domain
MDTQPLEADILAPVYSEATVHVSAAPEQVWKLLADVPGWPDWNPEIKEASIDGPLASGARITWRSGPGTIKSTVADVDPATRLSWRGSTMGIKAIHVWTLRPEDEGTTISTEESWSGPLVSLLKKTSKRRLDQALESGLRYVKAAAEDTNRTA